MTSVSKPYYVILTGSRNNAGDFLIKYRAKQLLKSLRRDRDVVDFDAWKPFTTEQLEIVNKSEALILMGGPSVQPHMYPGIYPMVSNLDEIKVPITMMGVGWKGLSGHWDESRHYALSNSSLELINRIAKDNLKVSVRDYHTLNVLNRFGIEQAVMTGCPATYSLESVGKSFETPARIKTIGFSLGVSFLDSSLMKSQMENLILTIRDNFSEAKLKVAFHHSLDDKKLDAPRHKQKHLNGHRKFANWLTSKGITYTDISGSAENLIDFYEACDLHIGYRVHAHIFMTSIGKPTLLVAEDGRGKALPRVFGGLVVDGFETHKATKLSGKILCRLGWIDSFDVSPCVVDEVSRLLQYEQDNQYIHSQNARCTVNNNFLIMKSWLEQLP